MLKEILDKSVCAECKFCCSFRRVSLWEVPFIADEVFEKLGDKKDFETLEVNGDKCHRMLLESKYKTDDENEEVPCRFLDCSNGCTLNGEDKPMDCKIWPLRIMQCENGEYVIALSPTCPAINKLPIESVKKVAKKIENDVRNYAKKHPFIIKKYIDGYPILTEFKKL